MNQRWTTRRSLGTAILVGGALLAASLVRVGDSDASQGKALVRGNVPGEWRFWAGDAWGTRYSALDQINARNFDSLKVAWSWNSGAFGADEYYRTTPLYANGRLFTVATTRRVTTALDPETGETLWMWRLDEGIRWQKAPRQFAGRGLGLSAILGTVRNHHGSLHVSSTVGRGTIFRVIFPPASAAEAPAETET